MRGWLNSKRDWPIRWQLSVFYAALLIAILGAFGLMLYWKLDGELIGDTEARLARPLDAAMARFASDSARMTVKIDQGGSARGAVVSPTGIQNAIEKTFIADVIQPLSDRDTRIALYDADANLLVDSGTYTDAPKWPKLPPKAFKVGMLGKPTAGVDDATDPRALILTRPFIVNGRTMGVVVVFASLASVDALLGALRLYLALGIVIATLVGVGVGVPLTRRILRPLDQVARTASEIAAGDLSRRVGLRGRRNEIGRVAESFDRMVEQLEAMIRAQRQFVADASHELRTPLTTLSGTAEMLLLGVDQDDAAARQRLLRRQVGEIERLSSLVADLLALSRLDANPTLVRRAVDLTEVAREVAEDLRQSYPDHSITVGRAAPALVSGEPDRLRQVIVNLVDNGCKYGRPGGRVAIGVQAHGEWAALTVADDGIGIADEALPRIFDRFFRADPSRARKVSGVGLGLAISKAIVEAHGGTIAAQSAGPGHGSTFTVRLKLVPPSQLLLP